MEKFVELNFVEAVPQQNTMSEQDGYKVYGDDGKTRWEPKEIFEENYKSIADGMGFGLAIYMLKCGHKLARKGWNGKGMFIYYVPSGTYPARTEAAKSIGELVDYGAYIAMKTAQGNVVPWLASQTDMLADDWEVIE